MIIPRSREEVVLEPGQRLTAVLRTIRGARERLRISFFRCDEHRVLEALADAVARGVRVDALLTRRVKGWEEHMKELGCVLGQLNVGVHWYASETVKYHAKYLVVDDGPALVASSNFTRECFTRTCDFLLATHDPQVVSGLKTLFEADCRAGESLTPTAGLCRRLIIGPGQARRRMTALLEQARCSIRIVDPKVTDPAIVRVLNGKRAEGVEVQVLGADAFLDRRAHGRLILVDGALAVIGSISLSSPALDRRRELSITSTDPTAIGRLTDFFRIANRRTGTRENTCVIAKGRPPRLPAYVPMAAMSRLSMA